MDFGVETRYKKGLKVERSKAKIMEKLLSFLLELSLTDKEVLFLEGRGAFMESLGGFGIGFIGF